MANVPPERGMAVISKNGRDKGKTFCVIQIIDADFVLIADGKGRKLIKPKKKRWKHLRPHGTLPAIAAKLNEGKKIFDSELASALKGLEQAQTGKE